MKPLDKQQEGLRATIARGAMLMGLRQQSKDLLAARDNNVCKSLWISIDRGNEFESEVVIMINIGFYDLADFLQDCPFFSKAHPNRDRKWPRHLKYNPGYLLPQSSYLRWHLVSEEFFESLQEDDAASEIAAFSDGEELGASILAMVRRVSVRFYEQYCKFDLAMDHLSSSEYYLQQATTVLVSSLGLVMRGERDAGIHQFSRFLDQEKEIAIAKNRLESERHVIADHERMFEYIKAKARIGSK